MGFNRVVAWSYKASREYDGMSEKSYTCTDAGAVAVMCFAGSARGSSHYIKYNGTEVGYAVNYFQNYGWSILFACFNVSKGDVITCKPYASDTGAWSYAEIGLFN